MVLWSWKLHVPITASPMWSSATTGHNSRPHPWAWLRTCYHRTHKVSAIGGADCKVNTETQGPSHRTLVLQINAMQHNRSQPSWASNGPEDSNDTAYPQEKPAALMAWQSRHQAEGQGWEEEEASLLLQLTPGGNILTKLDHQNSWTAPAVVTTESVTTNVDWISVLQRISWRLNVLYLCLMENSTVHIP